MSDTTTTPVPTGPDDITTRYDRGTYRPALNVKVYGSVRDLPASTFGDIVREYSDDPTLLAMSDEEIREATIAALERMSDRGVYWPEENASGQGWEDAQIAAEDLFGGQYAVKVWADGRSGGWLVVDGLPDPTDEDAWHDEDEDHDRGEWLDIAPVWAEFAGWCAALVADIPYQTAWQLIVNAPEEITGHVVDVTVRMILAPKDVDDSGTDPHGWDWRGMLDVRRETTIHVRDNRQTGNASRFRPY